MQSINYFSILLIVGIIQLTNGLYFHIAENERKCFSKDIPAETTISMWYKVQLHDPRSDGFVPAVESLVASIDIEVIDPRNKLIFSRVNAESGRVWFTSYYHGEHLICMHSNQLIDGWERRVHLDIQVGGHIIDYANATDFDLKIRRLLNQVKQIEREYKYQKYRHKHFRQTSESRKRVILLLSLVRTLIVVGTGFWLMRNLNRRTGVKRKFRGRQSETSGMLNKI